jgi:hypothetical protein
MNGPSTDPKAASVGIGVHSDMSFEGLHQWLNTAVNPLSSSYIEAVTARQEASAPINRPLWLCLAVACGVVPFALAALLSGLLYVAYKQAPEWMYEHFDQSTLRFIEPVMVIEHLRAQRVPPLQSDEHQMPLGGEPTSLFEQLRIEEYCSMTGNKNPYEVYALPQTPEEVSARKAEFNRFEAFTQSDAVEVFSSRVDMRCASLDFRWYWLFFTLLGGIAVGIYKLGKT